jgi:hypothetical protein
MALETVEFKAGDTFSYSASIPASLLNLATVWDARSSVCDMDAGTRPYPVIDTLVCTLTAPVISGDPYALLLYRSATDTNVWPRPSDINLPRRLLVDVELFDDSVDSVVHSTASFIIEVSFDPTRP